MAFPLLPTHTDPAPAMDEGLLLVEPERVLDGDLPNRDFESFYGPANTYLLAGIYDVTEPDVVIERGVGFVYRLAIIAGVFALASPAGLVVAVAAALISGTLMFTLGLAAFAYFGGLALAIAGLFLLTRATTTPRARGRLFVLAGVAGGLAIAYRPQFGAALLLGAVPLLIGHPMAAIKRLLIGAVIGILPLLVHTVLAGPSPVLQNLVVDAFFRSAPQSTRPFPPDLPQEARLMVLVALAVAVLALCAVSLWRRSPRSPDARRVAALALFCFGLAPQALGRAGAVHLIEVGCVAVPVVPYALIAVAGPRLRVRLRSLVPAAATAVIVAALAWSYVEPIKPGYGRAFQWPPWAEDVGADIREANHGSRSFPLSTGQEAHEAEETLAVIDRITDPGDRIVVGPDDLRLTFYDDTYLYHLLPELEPGTYYLTMTPGTANREGSRLADDIASADVVVLGTLPDFTQLTPNAEPGSGEASQVLAQHFCLVDHFFVHLIYERCR
ncbi:MAG TPA: hypothetical protein VEK39_02175 [Solirubrobacterales bacterium]|nr:hypothetical protein [Solirubrobacterales bacterium]